MSKKQTRHMLVAVVIALLVAQGGCEINQPIVQKVDNPEYVTFASSAMKETDPIGGNYAKMKGLTTGSKRRESLTDYWGDTVYPSGVFIVLFMDVQNCGVSSAYVSGYDTFWVRSGSGPLFDMSPLEASFAAAYEYGRIGIYDTLQPKFVYHMVFVFDVPPGGLYSLWYRPWGSSSSVQSKYAEEISNK